MAGLNNLLSDTQQTSTTMPDWYNTAQTNINTAGANAAANAPTLGQTTAGQAINTLQGSNNPFSQAQGTLNTIAQGAANPWITDSSGNVTPDTSTAMGGLFAAQNQQLNSMLPSLTSGTEAGAIGSGNFGSLRGQTAVDTARGNAFDTLAAQQMQAALTNQQQGVSAATNLGNVGQQGINAEMNVGQTEMNAPFTNATNYANLIGSMQVPTTTTSQVQTSPLTQAATLANALQGTGAAGGLGSLLFGTPATAAAGNTPAKAATSGLLGGTGGLSNSLSSAFGSLLGGAGSGATQSGSALGGGVTPGTYILANGGSMTVNPDGSQTVTNPGQSPLYFDASGNPVSETSTGAAVSPTPDNSGQYSGSTDTGTSTAGGTTQADINQAAADAGYTSYNPTQN